MRTDAGVRWTLDTNRDVGLHESVLTIDHSQFGSTNISVNVLHSDGFGTIREAEFGTGSAISEVIVHWINLPKFTAASWSIEVVGWSISFDQRSDYSEVFRGAGLDEQYALTHVGTVRRADGSDFEVETVMRLLHALQLGLSVALGRWVAPALPVGLNSRGARV